MYPARILDRYRYYYSASTQPVQLSKLHVALLEGAQYRVAGRPTRSKYTFYYFVIVETMTHCRITACSEVLFTAKIFIIIYNMYVITMLRWKDWVCLQNYKTKGRIRKTTGRLAFTTKMFLWRSLRKVMPHETASSFVLFVCHYIMHAR